MSGSANERGLSFFFQELLLNWNENVKQVVPADRLLITEVKEGWKPLCDFLDKPVPEEPFPRANDSSAAEKTFNDIVGKLQLVWLGGVSGLALTTAVLWLRWRPAR